MAAKAKDKLTPDGKKFFAEIEKLKKLCVRVGFQDVGIRIRRRIDCGCADITGVNLSFV